MSGTTSTPTSTQGGHVSHAPLITPLEDGVDPTPTKMRQYIYAFRWRVGRLGGFSEADILQWLRREGWEIDVTVAVFKELLLPEKREDHENNEPGRSLEQQQQDSMLAAASYSRHQNHRRSIDVLYEILTTKYPEDTISAMRLAYLLLRANFDLTKAVETHGERRTNADEMAEIDREERRLCMPGPNNSEPNDVHKDTRLRDFLEIAGTDDWVSAKAFLKKYDWNLGRAMDNWMQSGLPLTKPTAEDSAGRKGYRPPREPHTERDNMWLVPRPLFCMTATDASDDADAAADYGTAPYNHNQEGARFINYDPEPAICGIERLDKLEQQYISKGKGTMLTLGLGITDCGLEITGDDICFLAQRHIAAINKVYNQNPCRRGGIRKRQTAVQFTVEEETWIYGWHQGRVDTYKAAHPDVELAEDEGQTWKDLVSFSKKDLHRDYHIQFPAENRDGQSLGVKRGRMLKLCNDFGIKYQPARPSAPNSEASESTTTSDPTICQAESESEED